MEWWSVSENPPGSAVATDLELAAAPLSQCSVVTRFGADVGTYNIPVRHLEGDRMEFTIIYNNLQ